MKSCISKNSWIIFFTILFTISGCSEEETGGIQGELQVTESDIQADDGYVLLQINDLPGDITVDEENQFGAATHFTGAALSPAGAWLAITTAGTSHGAGWLYNFETEKIVPAAFQYGGTLETGPWDSSGRYMIFIEKNPASGQTLSISDIHLAGNSVSETSISIRLLQHEESGSGEAVYKPLEWDGEEFIFEVEGERYRYHPDIEEITED
ncbi:MAG: hypothetical protein JJU13_18275 [Balneolaceae bacterium]|nr:hypothetical protein [Balneolaceae bacterium]